MPRRYGQYAKSATGTDFMKKDIFEFYHVMSTYGSYILLAGFLLIAFYLIRSIYNKHLISMEICKYSKYIDRNS